MKLAIVGCMLIAQPHQAGPGGKTASDMFCLVASRFRGVVDRYEVFVTAALCGWERERQRVEECDG
jgi:hypothetical protein